MKATIEKLQAQPAEAKKAKEAADRANREAQQVAWQAIMDNPWNHEYTSQLGHSSCEEGELVWIAKRINPEAVAAFNAKGASIFHSDYMEEGRWLGMNHRRTEEGILYHVGGGRVILPVPMLCSDAEYASLLAGVVPNKFKTV